MAINTTVSGKILEDYLPICLPDRTLIQYKMFKTMSKEEQVSKKFLVQNYPYKSPTSKRARVEYYDVYTNTAIECKFQDVQGTAKQKLVYAGTALVEQSFYSIIVYEGKEFSNEFIDHCKDVTSAYSKSKNIDTHRVRFISLNELEKLGLNI